MKKIITTITVTLLSILSTHVNSADMTYKFYKCQDAQGKFIYQKAPCTENAQTINSWTQKVEETPATLEPEKNHDILVLKQAGNGHYFLQGEINSSAITFVVDTGASVLSLPSSYANTAHLYCHKKVQMDTANGVTNGCTATVGDLKLGTFRLKNVMALIVPNLTQPLLGMNILQHFNINQENGEMRISERERP